MSEFEKYQDWLYEQTKRLCKERMTELLTCNGDKERVSEMLNELIEKHEMEQTDGWENADSKVC